jgi:hypothetical protein
MTRPSVEILSCGREKTRVRNHPNGDWLAFYLKLHCLRNLTFALRSYR